MSLKRLKIEAFVFFLFLGILNLAAQDKVPNLQDLIGEKGTRVESELIKRNYEFISNTESGSNVYENWWHKLSKKCVTLRFQNGIMRSAVYAPQYDCNKKDSHTKPNKHKPGYSNKDEFSGVIGMKARWLDSEMNKRGYHLKNGNKSGINAYQNYWNERKRKCVTAKVSNGIVKSVTNTTTSNCKNTDTSGGGGSGYGGGSIKVDYLKGWKALSAYAELKSKGFHEIKKHTTNGKTYRIWYNKRTNQCIKTLSKNERIAEIMKSTHCDNR